MLSKKSQYAFRALTYLAEHFEEGPVAISEIAKKKKIPIKFLESILLQLKKENILESKKGKGGGYFLKLKPNQIKVAAVVRIVNGPISMLPCVSLYFYKRCKDCDRKKCGLKDVMTEVRDATLNILENRTLSDLLV
ncbi:MAG: Rrf2 family transcriptional regulator [Bacteroidetes bacterium]|nr:Rrf2 family transcriptional regulator [Bacteroidota bacterium]